MKNNHKRNKKRFQFGMKTMLMGIILAAGLCNLIYDKILGKEYAIRRLVENYKYSPDNDRLPNNL